MTIVNSTLLSKEGTHDFEVRLTEQGLLFVINGYRGQPSYHRRCRGPAEMMDVIRSEGFVLEATVFSTLQRIAETGQRLLLHPDPPAALSEIGDRKLRRILEILLRR